MQIPTLPDHQVPHSPLKINSIHCIFGDKEVTQLFFIFELKQNTVRLFMFLKTCYIWSRPNDTHCKVLIILS